MNVRDARTSRCNSLLCQDNQRTQFLSSYHDQTTDAEYCHIKMQSTDAMYCKPRTNTYVFFRRSAQGYHNWRIFHAVRPFWKTRLQGQWQLVDGKRVLAREHRQNKNRIGGSSRRLNTVNKPHSDFDLKTVDNLRGISNTNGNSDFYSQWGIRFYREAK